MSAPYLTVRRIWSTKTVKNIKKVAFVKKPRGPYGKKIVEALMGKK